LLPVDRQRLVACIFLQNSEHSERTWKIKENSEKWQQKQKGYFNSGRIISVATHLTPKMWPQSHCIIAWPQSVCNVMK